MKTITPAKDSISKIWGCPKPKDTVYRLLKYLLQVDVEDGVLLHNCVTGQLILLTNEEAEILSTLPQKPTETMRELIANHFLVPEDYDEYSSVKQLRKVFQIQNAGDAINHYVILPTTFCNAHCFYCYESDYPRVHMTEETANKLVEYIAEHRKDKNVVINWFGGEPLVGIERIDQISQALKDRGIPYSSSMITNGYLLDEETVSRCVELWKTTRIQITLDGTEEIYNQTKAYVNAKENPFQRVLRNIDLLSSKNIQVSIRLNVFFHNIDDIQTLIEDLGKRYSGKKNVSVYLSMLFDGQGYEPVKRSLEDTVTLVEIIEKMEKRVSELGLSHDRLKVPSLEFKQCIADSPHSIVIQPDGGFCRCEHENVLESYGNLDEGILNPQKPLIWKEIIERSEHCDECPLYPACYHLRYCMNADKPCIEAFQTKFRKRDERLIRSVYQKRLEEKENEKV